MDVASGACGLCYCNQSTQHKLTIANWKSRQGPRQECRPQIVPTDLIDPRVTDDRRGVAFQQLTTRLAVMGVSPSGQVRLVVALRGDPECRNARLPVSLGQASQWTTPEAQVPPPAPRGRHPQVAPVSIPVSPRLRDGVHLCGCQLRHRPPPHLPHTIVATYWTQADCARSISPVNPSTTGVYGTLREQSETARNGGGEDRTRTSRRIRFASASLDGSVCSTRCREQLSYLPFGPPSRAGHTHVSASNPKLWNRYRL